MNDDLAIAEPGTETRTRELPRMGEHRAVCCNIINIGHQLYEGKPSQSPKCIILFELEQKIQAGDYAGQKMLISQEFPMYMGEGTKLRNFLENWRGVPFSAEKLKGFTLANLIKANAKLVIIHNMKNGKTYANIGGISKADWEIKIVPTVTDIPKWILDKKAKAVKPQEQKAQAQSPATGPAQAPAAEDDLPF